MLEEICDDLNDDEMRPDAVRRLRAHGWRLWAGMTCSASDDKTPVWSTWWDASVTLRDDAEKQDTPSGSFRFPTQLSGGLNGLRVTDEASREYCNDNCILVQVLFNNEAHEFIRRQNLYQKASLDGLLDEVGCLPVAKREIRDFPRRAIAVKAVWKLVKAGECAVIPTWDPKSPEVDPARGNPPSRWGGGCVRVDIGEMTSSVVSCQDSVPISHFHTFEVTKASIESIAPIRCGSETIEVGDTLALVGLHATTKEIDDWVWLTFWWHPRADEGPFAAEKSRVGSDLRSPWSNYLMDITIDADAGTEPGGAKDVCFNPWLEAPMGPTWRCNEHGGVMSNCISCHRKAAWGGDDMAISNEIEAQRLCPDQGRWTDDDPYFDNKLKLDFLWSLYPTSGS